MSATPNINPLKIQGNKLDATAAPTAGDDINDGYNVGSVWINVSLNKGYICTQSTAGNAIWKEIGASSTDTNMANANLTLDANRSHNANGFETEYKRTTSGRNEWFLSSPNDGVSAQWLGTGNFRPNYATNSLIMGAYGSSASIGWSNSDFRDKTFMISGYAGDHIDVYRGVNWDVYTSNTALTTLVRRMRMNSSGFDIYLDTLIKGSDDSSSTSGFKVTSANNAVLLDVTNDGSVSSISTSSVPSFTAKSDGTTDGYIQLNCTANTHGIKLKSPPHSAAASYTLTFPDGAGSNGQALTTDGSGNLSWGAGGSDTNFANTNLTLDSERTHILGSNKLILNSSGATRLEFFGLSTTPRILGYDTSNVLKYALGQNAATTQGGYIFAQDGIDVGANDLKIRYAGSNNSYMNWVDGGNLYTQIGKKVSHVFLAQSGDLVNNKFIVGSSSVVGGEHISLQSDTLVKGSDTSSSTTGFKVIDSTNASLLDVKNNGKISTNGSNVDSSFNVKWNGVNNNIFTVTNANNLIHAFSYENYEMRNWNSTQTIFQVNNVSGAPKISLFHAGTEIFRIKSDGTSFLNSGFVLNGKDNLSSSSGFKVTDINNNSLLDIKNNGQINASSLPTSSAGLSSGDIWNNSGVLNIV